MIYQSESLMKSYQNERYQSQSQYQDSQLWELPEVAEEKISHTDDYSHDFSRLLSFDKHRLSTKR